MAHPLVATSAFSSRAKHSRIVGLGVFVVSAGLVSFGPGINGGYFFDDFLYVYLPSAGSWTDFFGRASGTSHAYRPLEAIILSWIQNHFGWSTWPIHALCFSLHSALAMLTYATARILGLTSLQAGIATIFLMVSQSTVSAVLGNDCLSQVLATTFGFASTFLFWRLRTQHPNATPTFATVLLFGIALFGKETAAGFLPVLALVAFGTARDREWVGRVVASCRAILPFLGAFVLYLASRSHAGATGPASAEGIYSLRFGVNILTNSIELVFSAFSPVSSVIVWTAAQSHRYPLLLLSFAVTAGFVAVTAYGIWKSGRMYVCAMLGVLGLASLSPVLILVHVSELYTYTAMPFFAIVVGAGWGTAIENGASAAARRITALLLAIFLLANVVASRSKAELMYDNGRRAAAVLGALVSELPAIPRNGEVLLVNPEDSRKEYSIFLLNAFNVVRYGNFKKIPDLLGRSDVHILIVEAVDVGHSHVENASAVLTFRNGAIYRIEPQPALPVPIAPLPSLEKRSSPVRDSLVSGH